VGSNHYRFGGHYLHRLMNSFVLTMNGFVLTRIIAASGLLAAMLRWPYSYYSILRWTVCIVAAYSAFRFAKSSRRSWAWIFVAVAVVFNPVAPIFFSRPTWRVVDLAAAFILLLSVLIPAAENRGEARMLPDRNRERNS
jgi:hypothetical protein